MAGWWHYGVDPEVIFLAAESDFGPTSHPCAAALDYKKAFDSCDFPIALEALRGLQIPLKSCLFCRINGKGRYDGPRLQGWLVPPRFGTAPVFHT